MNCCFRSWTPQGLKNVWNRSKFCLRDKPQHATTSGIYRARQESTSTVTTRQQQLNLKHVKDTEEKQTGRGRGRGKGRGRGRARGKGSGKSSADDSQATSSKRKGKEDSDQGNAKKTRRSKVQTQQDQDWQGEWDGHWREEWGEDWETGWHHAGKSWDSYAWWDGKESLSKIAKQEAGTGEQTPATETTSKAAQKLKTAPKTSEKPKAAPKTSAKSEQASKAKEKDKKPPKTKATSEAAPKAASSKPGENKPNRSKSKRVHVESKDEAPKKRKLAKVISTKTPKSDMVAAATTMLVTFGEDMVDVKEENMRKAIRSQLSGSPVHWTSIGQGLQLDWNMQQGKKTLHTFGQLLIRDLWQHAWALLAKQLIF